MERLSRPGVGGGLLLRKCAKIDAPGCGGVFGGWEGLINHSLTVYCAPRGPASVAAATDRAEYTLQLNYEIVGG